MTQKLCHGPFIRTHFFSETLPGPFIRTQLRNRYVLINGFHCINLSLFEDNYFVQLKNIIFRCRNFENWHFGHIWGKKIFLVITNCNSSYLYNIAILDKKIMSPSKLPPSPYNLRVFSNSAGLKFFISSNYKNKVCFS